MNNTITNDQILRMDERLKNREWPNLRKIEAPRIESGDCMLVCAGFEDRAITALQHSCESGKTGFPLGLITYKPEYQQNKADEMHRIARDFNLNMEKFTYDRQSPSGISEDLKTYTQKFNRVFVDISGMSRLLIVQILVALCERQPITLIYCEADSYPPSQSDFNQNENKSDLVGSLSYLSSGIFEIATTSELASVSMFGEAIRLVAFPSFNPAQLKNLLEELQPTYTELIHGVPPNEENKWRTEAVKRLNDANMKSLQELVNHNASTLDYKDTLDLLLKIYQQRSMFDRLVIAPTGSKMQAVAVGLFRAALYDIQIVYPTPQTFKNPDQYTMGIHQMYKLDILPGLIKD